MGQILNELIYSLEVRVPDQSPRKFEVHDHVLAGLDPRNDLILVDPLISARHFLFKSKDGLLTVQFLGGDDFTFLNNIPLENGKLYLLEKGDRLKCGKVEIRIRQDLAPVRPRPEGKSSSTLHKEFLENAPLGISPTIPRKSTTEHVHEMPGPAPKPEKEASPGKEKEQKKNKFERVLALKKIPLKVYGFLFDVVFTYFFLSYLIPASGLLEKTQSLLYPMTEFFNKSFLIAHPEFAHWKILSVAEFFLSFHMLMIGTSLILGNTPGAFLLGLHPLQKNFLGNRFKAYLYTLVNVFALPLLVLDIPLFKGRTLKEWSTFYQRDILTAGPFKLFRTTLVPSLIVIFSLSPLFLKYPFPAVVVEEKLSEPKFKETHTQFITSESSTFGVSLKTELNSQFSVLPLFDQKKIGLTLYDHSTGKSLLMQEEWRMKTDYALFKLRYSNPLSSQYLPNEEMSNEQLKTKAFQALRTSPLNFLHGLHSFGYFFGNGVLFKQQFLQDFSPADSFVTLPFHQKNPFLLVSSQTEDMLFWFTPKEIIAFRLTVPKQTRLLDIFTRDILAGMRFNQAYGDKLKTPQILEALEAFERENYQTLLTYYIYEAKKASSQKAKNSETDWSSFLKNNILQTKLALNGTRNKNIEKSFDDIINSL